MKARTDAKLNLQLDMVKKFNKFIKGVVGLDGEEESPTNEDDLAIQVGFVPGAHIQVFFLLDDEEVWWNAKVIDHTGDTYEVILDGEEEEEESNEEEQVMHLPIYKIRYEARAPEYPKSQVAYVCVADEDKLIDIEAEEGNDTLTWRLRDETRQPDEAPDALKSSEDASEDEEELA